MSALADEIPGVRAKSYIVTDLDGNVVLEHDSRTVRPIASISKLLMAEQIIPLLNPDEQVSLVKEDVSSRRSRIKNNTKLSEQQLLELALIPSNNQAIYALSRVHDTDKMVAAVNDNAFVRGMTSIHLEEPSGLSENNHASAEDLAHFVGLVKDSPIASVSTEEYTSYGHFHSTNPFLGKPGWNFDVSKTGYIHASGGCLATLLEIGGRKLIVIILGSNDVHSRWADLVSIRTYISATDVFWHEVPTKILHPKKRRK